MPLELTPSRPARRHSKRTHPVIKQSFTSLRVMQNLGRNAPSRAVLVFQEHHSGERMNPVPAPLHSFVTASIGFLTSTTVVAAAMVLVAAL